MTAEGLIKGHAYAITDTKKVSVAHGGRRRPAGSPTETRRRYGEPGGNPMMKEFYI